MGLFSGIKHAISNVADSATDLGNNLVLGPTGALVNGIVDIKDPIDKTWKTITPWNDNSEGAIGIGKITPWKESGNLVSPSTFADIAAMVGAAYGGASMMGGAGTASTPGLSGGGITSGGVTSGGITNSGALSVGSNPFGVSSSLLGGASSSTPALASGATNSGGLFGGMSGLEKGLLGLGAANSAMQGVGMYMNAQQQNALAKAQDKYNRQQQTNYDNTNNMAYSSKYDYSSIQQKAANDPAYYAGVKSAVDRIKSMRGQS